jgi:cytochrome c553
VQNAFGFGIIATRFDHCNLGENEMKVLLKALACIMLLLSMPVIAAGDPAKGKEVSGICASCHGVDGNSTLAMWPKLAGQHEGYLERQLGLIKSGARSVPEMTGIVMMLSDEDSANVSAYFSDQESSPAIADPALIALGEKIYRAGNEKTDVPACMACHGPAGMGNPQAGYPLLAGQHSVYLGKMLSGFRSGTSFGEDDPQSQVMVEVSARLTDSEIEAVSSYIQGLYSKTAE